nr:PREDICTED: tumor necrosis factor alpha-induced protein 8-like protein 2 [Lepisosteus oculatus]
MEGFSSKDMAMQMQKKILSRMASKSMVQMFIDDLLLILPSETKTKQNDAADWAHPPPTHTQTHKQKKHVFFFPSPLISLFLTFPPRKVEFTFDKAVMAEILTDCRDMLLRLVDKHLTAKSHGRINHVFNHFADTELLTQLYNPGGPFRPNLQKICTGLNKLVEEGKL